jgi:hypothetical protein
MNFLKTVDLPYAEKYRSAIFMHPRWTPTSAWRQHIPFAFFLMAVMRPKKVVELGTFLGASFFAFCQAAREFKIECECFAVDTWEGDDHAGHYDDDFYKTVVAAHAHYKDFAYLLRMEFDKAAKLTEMKDIDLLHIDGLHTYEAVKHDFETWLPKMSDEGVIIFHDTAEIKDDFGVWRLWDEISVQYPSFNFMHGHGLGVLLVGDKVKKDLRRFASSKHFDGYDHLFQVVGVSI